MRPAVCPALWGWICQCTAPVQPRPLLGAAGETNSKVRFLLMKSISRPSACNTLIDHRPNTTTLSLSLPLLLLQLLLLFWLLPLPLSVSLSALRCCCCRWRRCCWCSCVAVVPSPTRSWALLEPQNKQEWWRYNQRSEFQCQHRRW